MVHRSKKGAIGPCGLLVLQLKRRRWSVSVVGPCKFLGRRLSFSSAGPIEANIVHRLVVDDGLVVGVGDDGCVHPSDGGVVKEHPVIPISALVADASIAEAVVDAAIISDVRPPVSGVPSVKATIVAPVAGRPQQPDNRWQHPGTRYPVIVILTVGPVAWRPYVAGAWAERLLVNGKNRRSDTDGYADRGTRGSRRTVIAGRRWTIIARRRVVVSVSPRIGLGGTAKHPDTCPDGSARPSAPAAADDAANDGSHCRALNSALHYLRRCKCARPNTGPNQGQATDQDGEYADECHEIPPPKATRSKRAALKHGASLDEITKRSAVAKVDGFPVWPIPAGTSVWSRIQAKF